jgi:RimJ/RimL family protein N-acetyltransferase
MNDDELPAFTSMPTSLTTDRLIMRPFAVDDAPLHAEMISERGPGARHYGATVAAVEQIIQRLLRDAAEHGFGLYVLERVDDAGFIGYCGLIVGRGSISEAEIAYELLSRFHGRGYATEAASAVVEAARDWPTSSCRNHRSDQHRIVPCPRKGRVRTCRPGG